MSTTHEPKLPPSREGSVVLDIGGEIGALVVEVGVEWLGREPDLLEEVGTRPLMHTEVRARELDEGTRYYAVYPAVPAGRYRVEGFERVIPVEGGRVTEVSLLPVAMAVGSAAR